jgi:hypothetical protein
MTPQHQRIRSEAWQAGQAALAGEGKGIVRSTAQQKMSLSEAAPANLG